MKFLISFFQSAICFFFEKPLLIEENFLIHDFQAFNNHQYHELMYLCTEFTHGKPSNPEIRIYPF